LDTGNECGKQPVSLVPEKKQTRMLPSRVEVVSSGAVKATETEMGWSCSTTR